MDVRQLKHLNAIITFGGFGRAASMLNISQSALTQSIGNLERELGVSLLERSQAGARPTAAGTLLHNRSELILMEIERATLELREVGGSTPEIRVGIDKNLSPNFFAAVLKKFLAARRHMVLLVRERWHDELEAGLVRGELDLIVSSLPGFVDDYNIVKERLFDKSIRALVRKGHPLFSAGQPEAGDLAQALWGIRAPSPGGAGADLSVFPAVGMPIPEKIIYTDSTAVILSMVRDADMIGFLATSLAQAEIERGAIVPVEFNNLHLREPVYIAHHARSRLKTSVAQLKSAITDAARTLVESRA